MPSYLVMKIRLADIVEETSSDGPGLRTSIYLAGCDIKCPGCHNVKYQDVNSGELVDIEDIVNTIKQDQFIDGVTILGGEPFMQPVALYELIKRIRLLCPKLTIWVYTGHKIEKLKAFKHILSIIDCLVEGPYIAGLKTDKAFVGSDNQRVLSKEEIIKIL